MEFEFELHTCFLLPSQNDYSFEIVSNFGLSQVHEFLSNPPKIHPKRD